jgi:hypothetical protein
VLVSTIAYPSGAAAAGRASGPKIHNAANVYVVATVRPRFVEETERTRAVGGTERTRAVDGSNRPRVIAETARVRQLEMVRI